jgi:iron(III) transport system permease protein
MRDGLRRWALVWGLVGGAALALLPWYAAADGTGPGRILFLVPALALVASLMIALIRVARAPFGLGLIGLGGVGFLYLVVQGFVIGGQPGMGIGAAVVAASLLMLFSLGLAARGFFRGDAFVAGAVVVVAVLVGLFTFYPVARIVLSAVQGSDGALSVRALVERLFAAKIWRLDCLTGGRSCGVGWNTLLLAVLTASTTTMLGLAFALIVTRTGFKAKRLLRVLTVLPIITPPFVIGLGLILIFGRSGLVNQLMEWAFAVPPSRWIYGLPGVWLAQTFAFTPVAFLVLIGVVEGVSPSLEEASQTLRASRWHTFSRVSLPLMRPGLANAFLVGFVESIADFGNPIVLGGNFGVLSTEVFFSIVGAQLDQGRAAALGVLLLALALGAFVVQRRVVGRTVYTAISGKGDSGRPAPLPPPVRRLAFGVALPWAMLTVTIYAMALAGGFVETWGRNYTPTLRHYAKAFSIEWGTAGVIWSGSAWRSFWTTLELASIAAPLTAALGILTAYLLVRHRFVGRAAFEFATMLSFAIPGTVIGVSYILAFNAADRADRNGRHPDRLLRVQEHARRSSRRHGRDEPDRRKPRRGFAHARRHELGDLAPRDPAALTAGRRGGARLQLRSRHDDGQRRHLPGLGRLRHGHDLHHPPGAERRLRRRDRLQLGADRADARGHRAHPAAGRRAQAPPRGAGACPSAH